MLKAALFRRAKFPPHENVLQPRDACYDVGMIAQVFFRALYLEEELCIPHPNTVFVRQYDSGTQRKVAWRSPTAVVGI